MRIKDRFLSDRFFAGAVASNGHGLFFSILHIHGD